MGPDEEIEARPSGTTQEEEVHTNNSQDFISEAIQEEEVQLEIPQDIRAGG